jgi:hypothetical protein
VDTHFHASRSERHNRAPTRPGFLLYEGSERKRAKCETMPRVETMMEITVIWKREPVYSNHDLAFGKAKMIEPLFKPQPVYSSIVSLYLNFRPARSAERNRNWFPYSSNSKRGLSRTVVSGVSAAPGSGNGMCGLCDDGNVE